MTTNGAPACRCGLAMRISDVRDAWECRCGLWLDADASNVVAARTANASIPDAAFQQGESWKEHAPGLRISDKFGDISAPTWAWIEVDPAKFSDKATLQRLCADAFECTGLHYVAAVKPMAARDLTIEGETLKRHSVYALVPVGQEAEAIRGVVQFIRAKHGPGRLWAHGGVPIGPLKKREQDGHRGAEVGGVLHVALGCYYFHRPTN